MRAWGWHPLAADLPVSSALGDVHQLLYASRISQSLGVLHILAGDLVQGAADGTDDTSPCLHLAVRVLSLSE